MPIILNGTEIQNTNGATFIEKVTNYFIGQGGVANSPFGTVVLDKRGAKNSKNHGIGSAKAAAFAAVKDVLEQGSIQVPMEQYGTNPNKEYLTGMVVANIQISGIGYTCVVEVCKNKEGLIRLYNHEVTPINTKPQNAVATSRVSGGETTPRLHKGAMAKVARKYQDNNKEIEESKNMKKNTIKLNEQQLRSIVAESVKKVLNEISADMYTRAAEKAYELGRPRQAQNFMDRAQDVGVDDFCKKLIGGEVIEADTDIITYKPRESSYTKTIQNDGYWMSSFGSRGNLANDTTMSSNLKVDDKVTARKLAAWWKKYGKTELPIKLDDWHVWCNL